MSRNLRALFAIVVLSFAFSVTACADAFGPHAGQCDTSGGNVCH